jgi:hypothetical protein
VGSRVSARVRELTELLAADPGAAGLCLVLGNDLRVAAGRALVGEVCATDRAIRLRERPLDDVAAGEVAIASLLIDPYLEGSIPEDRAFCACIIYNNGPHVYGELS